VKTIHLTIDGRKVTVPEGVTVLEAIQRAGRYVPTLCYDPVLKPLVIPYENGPDHVECSGHEKLS
jgi:NADH dehydrogenase/NADH:ubiquinone oxidoreductase subunit G